MTITIKPKEKPMTVANPRPIRTFSHPSHSKTDGPAAANPAPDSPATSAWVSLVGSPHRHARVLQITIAIMPEATVCRPTTSGLIIPVPMVVATAVPVTSAPTIFSIAAIVTAWRGERTRVETTVAIALGASVQPLTNSAASTTTKAAIKRELPSAILEDYPFKYIGDIFAPVGGIFQMLIQFSPFDYLTCISGTSFK